jgi:hypothetical protein
VKAKYWIVRSVNIATTPEGMASLQLLMKNMADPLFLPHK